MKWHRWSDTKTSDVKKMLNKTEDNDNDDAGFNDNGDDDNDDDGGDDEGNFVDGVTANGDASNIKHLIGGTRWCFLKHKTSQVSEEITFIVCTTTLEENNCIALYKTTAL